MAGFSDASPPFPPGPRISPFLHRTGVKLLPRLYGTMPEIMNPPHGPMDSRITIAGHKAFPQKREWWGFVLPSV